jgi:hypothetical protein
LSPGQVLAAGKAKSKPKLPATDSAFLAKLLPATLETLAMSIVGTLLAAGSTSSSAGQAHLRNPETRRGDAARTSAGTMLVARAPVRPDAARAALLQLLQELHDPS